MRPRCSESSSTAAHPHAVRPSSEWARACSLSFAVGTVRYGEGDDATIPVTMPLAGPRTGRGVSPQTSAWGSAIAYMYCMPLSSPCTAVTAESSAVVAGHAPARAPCGCGGCRPAACAQPRPSRVPARSAGGPNMSENHGRGGSGPVKWCTSNFGGPLGPVKVETAVGPQRLCAPQAGKKSPRAARALPRTPPS